MACISVTSGRLEPCKNSAGGLKKALFIDYIENAFTVVSGEVTAIAIGVSEVFEYPLRADENTFEEAVVSDKNTGVTINTQTLQLRLKKQDFATSNQVKMMAYGRPIVVVVGYDGAYKVAGATEGMDLTDSNIQSGGAKTDFNGYDLTFTAEEFELAPFLNADTITAIEALVSATNIDA